MAGAWLKGGGEWAVITNLKNMADYNEQRLKSTDCLLEHFKILLFGYTYMQEKVEVFIHF